MNNNPYEQVEVPNFNKNDDIDMSVFQLTDDDLDDQEEKSSNAGKIVMLITMIIAIILAGVLAFLLISTNNKYKTLQSSYETYKNTSDSQISRLESQIDTLTKENEELKKANETVVADDQSEGSGTISTGEMKAGTYTVISSMRIRTDASSSASLANYDTLPAGVKEVADSAPSIMKGSQVTVTEVKTIGSNVWGKIGDNLWICLKLDGEALVK